MLQFLEFNRESLDRHEPAEGAAESYLGIRRGCVQFYEIAARPLLYTATCWAPKIGIPAMI